MRIGKSQVLAITLLIVLSASQASGQYSQSNSPGAVAASRVVPLTIKIVMLGFSSTDLNSSYLTSGINSIPVKYQQVLQGPINTGVVFNFTYQYVYEKPDSTVVQSFVQYLNSIGKKEDTVPGSLPPNFGNPAFNKTGTMVNIVHNYFYDASKVENWLTSNQTLFGTVPSPGYTFFIANLNKTMIPSLSYQQYQAYTTSCPCGSYVPAQAHYYNRTATDPDLYLNLTRHYMTGWGGTGRIYYTDLSAGTSYWTDELPIQVAAGARGVNLLTPYGRIWAAEFVNDYIAGAVSNLFAADQLYPVTYAQKYNFQLFVLDNRTAPERAKGPKISTTLNTTKIQSELAILLPFAKITVSAKFSNITDYPQLAAVVANATSKVKDPVLSLPIVDARLVWNWLSVYGKGHLTQFINVTHTTSQYDIPGFLFAFQGNYTFAFTFKENIALSEPPGSIGGVALGDMILVNQSNSTLTAGYNAFPKQPGRGVGFTRAATHELGHMMGLNHPFLYDQTEDFTNSVMAYYPDSSTFSQFDKDTVLRGINDELLIVAQDALAVTGNSLVNSGTIATARQEMALANQHYSTMDYAGAVLHSLAAALNALQAEQSGSLFSSGLVFGLIGLVAGAAIGLLVGFFFFFFFFRKRKVTNAVGYNVCPTCRQPVRWDVVQMKWYCDRCQKPV
ncbi:MAG TPA: hypothetical protein VGS11_02015 [Candidatus Bathyarchaeia archaeon]|nr:hypothetical protein [Candidatus Bathyarchaeia archaeon]